MSPRPSFPPPGGGGFGVGLAGPVPRDLWVLLGVVLGTFTLQHLSAATAAWMEVLRLGPALWQRGFVWQLVTYAFVGTGAPGIWFLLELLILFLFGRQVLMQLGPPRFWVLLVQGALVSALAAAAVALLSVAVSGAPPGPVFLLLQGQHMLLILLIAAFATVNAEATIYLFFVLPVQARFFLGLEILFAFMGYLSSRDLAGFLGICAGVAFTWARLRRGGSGGGRRELWLRAQERWIRLRLGWLKRRRGLRVVRGERPDDPWVN